MTSSDAVMSLFQTLLKAQQPAPSEMGPPALDLLKLSASELQSLMHNGELTSLQLVRLCLAQIQRNDRAGHNLRAMISLPSADAIEAEAKILDQERSQGKLRGPFHGLPIIVKDSINTDLRLDMGTTLGSYAFEKSMPKKSASVVEKLTKRGLIILGKANLTELGNFKGDNLTSGWSAFGGQTQSAYVRGGVKKREIRLGHSAPGGSSSGSAVGVSAGFSPLSIGTEADGSIVTPASRAAPYAMKPTVGSVAMDGIFVISRSFDVVGGMAKTVSDLAHLTEHTLDEDARSKLPVDGFESFLKTEWSGLRIGVLQTDDWTLPPALVEPNEGVHAQTRTTIAKFMEKVKSMGASVVFPVELTHPLKAGMFPKMSDVMNYEARSVIESYFSTRDDPKMKKVEDLIAFNEENAELELPKEYPNQKLLRGSVEHSITPGRYEELKTQLRRLALDSLKKTLYEHELDAIVGPTDSPLNSIAASAGGPVTTVPLGFLDINGRAFGLSIVALPGQEQTLFRIMSAYEATYPPRALPPLLAGAESSTSL